MSVYAELSYVVHEDAFGNHIGEIATHNYVEESSSLKGIKVVDPIRSAIEHAIYIRDNCTGISDINVVMVDTQSPAYTNDHRINIDL